MVTLAGAEHHKHEVFESRAEFISGAINPEEVLRFLNLQTPNNWGVPSIIQDIEIHSGRLYKNFKQLHLSIFEAVLDGGVSGGHLDVPVHSSTSAMAGDFTSAA